MRQSFNVIAVAAGLAAISYANYSEYWTHWQEMMDAIDCANGPVACGTDENGEPEFCSAGYACLQTVFGDKCDDVARYQCNRTCADSEALNPLRYCECISEEARTAMFCASAPVDAAEPEPPTIDGGPTTIICECGVVAFCNAGT